MDTYARAELKGVHDLKLQELATNGMPALRVSYSDQVAAGISTANVVYYVGKGNRLYKFYLTYGLGDVRERELMETLDMVVRRAVLK